MTSRDSDDRYSYSTAALARLALSEQLSAVADHAASLVPTTSDRGMRDGEMVDAARALVSMAKEAMERAVLYERAQHTSWETIGEVLDITRQSAHAKFREAEQNWTEALQEPFDDPDAPILNLRLPEAAYQPTTEGRRLDAWAVKHCDEQEHSVTGGLKRLSVIEEMSQVIAALNHLYNHPPTATAGQNRYADLLDRKARLLDRLAAEEGRAEATQQAAQARAAAAEARRATTVLDPSPAAMLPIQLPLAPRRDS